MKISQDPENHFRIPLSCSVISGDLLWPVRTRLYHNDPDRVSDGPRRGNAWSGPHHRGGGAPSVRARPRGEKVLILRSERVLLQTGTKP